MNSPLRSKFVPSAIGLVIVLLFMSVWFQSYCRRRRLKGSRAHPFILAAYYALSGAAMLAAMCVAASAVSESSNQGFLTQAYRILTCVFFMGWVLSLIRDTLRKSKSCSAALSPGELEDLRIEETIAQLNPFREAASLSILGMFFLTFFGIIAFAPFCLGKNYGMDFSFMTGWLGWVAGLSIIFRRVGASGAGRIALAVLVPALGMAAVWLAKISEHPLGAVVLFAVGLAGGGAFAIVCANAQAGAFVGEMTLRQRACALFHIPTRAEFLATKAQTEKRLLHARTIADHKSDADHGDADAQFALWSLYGSGDGALQDKAEACKWCLLAAAQGHEHAISIRDQFPRFAAAQDIGEGQQRASRFVIIPNKSRETLSD